MKHFFAYTLLFLLAQPLFATSIVVWVTPDYILMAADSKRMFIDNESNTITSQTVCKIHKVKSYCYSMAGLVASRSTGFSAEVIVTEELKKGKSLNNSIERIKARIKEGLQKEFSFQKRKQMQLYEKTLLSKDHILEIVILSMKENTPAVQIVGFELEDEENITVNTYTTSCPGACPDIASQIYFLGDYSGMNAYLQSKQEAAEPISFMEQLIKAQAAVTPRSVSTPVNIIKYSRQGVEWIQ